MGEHIVQPPLRPEELLRGTRALLAPDRSLVIVGEPGIGKFTLATEIAVALAAQLGRRAAPRTLLLSGAASLREIPFALFSGALPAPEVGDGGGAETGFARAEEAVHLAIQEHPGGLLLLVDNVSHADPASLVLIAALAQRPGTRVILTLPERNEIPVPVASLLRSGRATRLDLGPLSAEQTVELAVRELGASRIEAEAAARLHRDSGGNPLYLLAILRRLARTGGLLTSGGLVGWAGDDHDNGPPASLTDFLASELAESTPAVRAALAAVALAEPISLALIRRLGPLVETQAVDALLELRLLLLTSTADGTAVLRTANQLIGDTVRANLPPGERLALLEGIARALPENLVDSSPEAVVRGTGLLLDLGETPEAPLLRRALSLVHSANDYRATIRFGGALAKHRGCSDTERCAAAANRLTAIRMLGDPGLMVAVTDGELEAEQPAPGDDDALRLARVDYVLAAADIRLYRDDDLDGAFAALDLAREALAGSAGEAARALTAGTVIRLGYAGLPRAALALAADAAARGEQLAPVPVAAVLALIAGQAGQLGRARRLAWRSLPLAAVNDRRYPTAAGELVSALFTVELFNGRLRSAAGLHRRILAELASPARGYVPGTGLIGIASGSLALAEGRWGDAAAEYGAAVETLRHADGTGFLPIGLAGLALAHAASGRAPEARAALVELDTSRLRASRIVEGVIALQAVSARIWLGEPDAADAALALADWAAERDFPLVELRALHLASAAGWRAEDHPSTRAQLLAQRIEGPIGRDLAEAIAERDRSPRGTDGVATRRLARQGVRAPGFGSPSLTVREHEVAGYAVLGYSAKAIAQALGLSPRTAESHLSRVFTKLGVNDRDGLAEYLADRRPLGGPPAAGE